MVARCVRGKILVELLLPDSLELAHVFVGELHPDTVPDVVRAAKTWESAGKAGTRKGGAVQIVGPYTPAVKDLHNAGHTHEVGQPNPALLRPRRIPTLGEAEPVP